MNWSGLRKKSSVAFFLLTVTGWILGVVGLRFPARYVGCLVMITMMTWIVAFIGDRLYGKGHPNRKLDMALKAEPLDYECGKCGEPVSVSTKVCPKCGADVSEIET